MADNVPITPGSGATVATDEIGGIHYQIVKVAKGGLDSVTLIDDGAPLPVAPMDVNGNVVTDDAPAAGPIYPVAGIYQSSPDEIDSGDVGRIRVTRRRAIITASDFKLIALTATNPNPSGNDITEAGGAPVASDFQIRDTNPRYFNVPMVRRGWRNVTIGFYTPTAFDQTMDFRLYGVPTGSWSNLWGQLLRTTVSATAVTFTIDSGASDGAVGELLMADPVLSGRIAHIPALRVYPSFTIRIAFSVAPTVGEFQMYVTRST